MPIYTHYLLVIIIWSTTPLAIKLSSQTLAVEAALLLRIALAVMLASLIAVFIRSGRLRLQHYRFYLVGSLSIFPNMTVVYWASAYISSGLISVLFALAPLVSFALSFVIYQRQTVTVKQGLAFTLALLGLVLIFFDQINFAATTLYGIAWMLVSNVLFASSQLGLKSLQESSESKPSAFEQAFGSMLFSLPGLLLSYCWFAADIVISPNANSLWAVAYLAVIGSVLGFMAYYAILQGLPVLLVSIIPMITPALALWLGVLVLDETVSRQLLIGSLLILFAVSLFEQFWLRSWRYLQSKF